MTEPNASQPEPNPAGGTFKRNYRLGLVNGTLARLGNSILHPQLVLAAFVYDQTRSKLLVGLLTAVSVAAHKLPQLYVSSLIEHRERKKLYYVVASVVRFASLLLMAAAILLAGQTSLWWPLALFFVVYCVFRTAQGSASLPFLDIMAGSIGPSRMGGLFGVRHFLGGGMALLGGFLIVQPLLDRVASPASYALLTLVAAVALGLAWCMFLLVRESPNPDPPKRRAVWEVFVAGLRLLRDDANYRRLFYLRVLGYMNGLLLVFYVPYGVEKVGVVGLSGIFLGLFEGSRLVSSRVWGRIGSARGNRLCLVLAGLFFAVSPAAALAAPRAPELFRWAVPATSVQLDFGVVLFLLALCCYGFALQASIIGMLAFTIESAPAERRPSYVAFLNTATFPLAFLSGVVGLLVGLKLISLTALFVVVAASGLLTLLTALRLREVRPGLQ
jgi:MFS family permease